MQASMKELTRKYPELRTCEPDIVRVFEMMKLSFRQGGKVLLCGNGGSASDCEHIVGELMKGFMSTRKLPEETQSRISGIYPEDGEYLSKHLQGALPAISLVSQSALLTAFANDVAPDMIYAQQVFGYGCQGDVLLALSTSGNSQNVLRAVQIAKVQGLRTIGMTGEVGGKLRELCDVTIRIPSRRTPDIQERHLPIYHALCIMLEEEFFPS
ncbi:SIS domain-containing protein [Cohnella sp. WQ 127256]|uniref:D-sedoheptulose-7-phosphate isomerase n=1 Tax=Cohnella sp. WQ 127256 TaxID=2938790 RepID=UPI002118A653|nr:SIS domain-containing protein [Cohnella sp. WQ 127256]